MKSLAFLCLLAFAATPALAANFTLSSPDLKPNAPIGNRHVLNGFGCSGDNISPALSWSGAPDGTKSFVVTLYDPDAPTRQRLLALGDVQHPGNRDRACAGRGNQPRWVRGHRRQHRFRSAGLWRPLPAPRR